VLGPLGIEMRRPAVRRIKKYRISENWLFRGAFGLPIMQDHVKRLRLAFEIEAKPPRFSSNGSEIHNSLETPNYVHSRTNST
jgi:hypothetical protein